MPMLSGRASAAATRIRFTARSSQPLVAGSTDALIDRVLNFHPAHSAEACDWPASTQARQSEADTSSVRILCNGLAWFEPARAELPAEHELVVAGEDVIAAAWSSG